MLRQASVLVFVQTYSSSRVLFLLQTWMIPEISPLEKRCAFLFWAIGFFNWQTENLTSSLHSFHFNAEKDLCNAFNIIQYIEHLSCADYRFPVSWLSSFHVYTYIQIYIKQSEVRIFQSDFFFLNKYLFSKDALNYGSLLPP